jgi:hypothetical protein
MPVVRQKSAALVTKDDLLVLPNPSFGDSKVQWAVSVPVEHSTLRVVDALGRVVLDQSLGSFEAGIHTIDLESSLWPVGSYGVQLIYTTSEGVSGRLGTIMKRIR